MNNILEILTIQIVLWFALLKVKKLQYSKWIVLCPILNIPLCLGLYYYNSFILYIVGAIFFYIVSPVIFTKNKKISAVIITSIMLIGVFLFISTLLLILLVFLKVKFIDLRFSILIGMTIMLICLYFFQKKNINDYFDLLSIKIKIVLMFFIWSMLIVITLLSVCILQIYKDMNIIVALGAVIVFFTALSFCIVFFLIFNNAKNSYYSSLTAVLEERIKEQVKYYEQLSKSNNDLRKFRHDYTNLAIGLKSYLLKKDFDGAMKFLDNCNSITANDNLSINTGNQIVDALLSDKSNKIDENIKINFCGIIPKNNINPVDLCIIFGNALDNAIEACEELPPNEIKEINISSKLNRGYLFIQFTNPTVRNVKIKNNRIESSKKDKNFHGIGLYSIDKAVRKYNGYFSIECKNKVFMLNTDLSLYEKYKS